MDANIPSSQVVHKPRFLEKVRRALRLRHYSIRTEQTYLDWIRQFIVFHGKRHLDEIGEAEAQAVLSQLSGSYRLMANLLYGSGLRLN